MIGAVIASKASSNVVNVSRQCAARHAKRRSQPRTVLTGRSSSVAILRCPIPLALASNPDPITAALSALRTSMNAGSRTCVCGQIEQAERRGRHSTVQSSSRTPRDRA